MFRKKKDGVEAILYSGDRAKILSMVKEMGGMAAEAFRLAVQSLEERDDELASKVIADDDAIDDMEAAIDNECLCSIALRQPVREDLRFVFAVLKIIMDLERIGDQGVNIAQKAMLLNRYPLLKPLVDIPKMRDIATEMVADSLKAFEKNDIQLAMEICMRDDELDELYESIFDELIEILARNSNGDEATAQRAAGLLWIARHLARIGDHATNVAERVYFMVEGERLKPIIEARKKALHEDK
ncbi:MAG: phosphate signaling complex protein PhoU [Synergistaceae bacterium]|nr:phosphate signaling complex protein PhoU [Synergistota bacterium]NLM70330.1 phosphate signaling complex protein PhoU [Synergistaceae bacterium]